MDIKELKKQLAEKETLKEQTFIIFQQLTGQISLLKDIITQEENKENKLLSKEVI